MSVTAYLKKYWKVVLALSVTLITLAVITYLFVAPRGYYSGLSDDLKVIAPSEEASYTDLDGNPVDLSIFKGKPLIINAWATWIPFSQTELPLLAKLKDTHGDTLHIVAINRMEQIGIIRSFLDTFGISQNGIVFLADPTDYFYRAVEGYAMPETIFYSATGELIAHKRGVITETELQDLIARILTE